MIDDLVAFLRAMFDKDEQVARAAGGDTWTASDDGIYPEDASNHPGPLAVGSYGYLEREYGDHIALHDPKRELRQVKAQRGVLDAYERAVEARRENAQKFAAMTRQWPQFEDLGKVKAHGWELDGKVSALAGVVKMLAAVHADHPDYRDEWRP